MKSLKEKIEIDGKVLQGNILKVDSFLNHQIDTKLFYEIGQEFKEKFKDKPINKIITIEASGIAVAMITSLFFDKCPVVFAKKTESLLTDETFYETDIFSYTKQKQYTARISRNYLNENDHILIVDDFLANGEAACGLIRLCKQAGAKVEGVGIVVEKGFQDGRKKIESQGIQLESLAIIEKFENNKAKIRG